MYSSETGVRSSEVGDWRPEFGVYIELILSFPKECAEISKGTRIIFRHNILSFRRVLRPPLDGSEEKSSLTHCHFEEPRRREICNKKGIIYRKISPYP